MTDIAKTISGLVGQLSPEKRQALIRLLNVSEAAEPIAVVGMGCRFPGGVRNPEDFWDLLIGGGDAITEIPATRFDLDQYYDPDPTQPGKINTRWGGFLDNIDQFDAAFFGISPREAISLDPQQRLLLEVSWEALENAGLDVQQLAGSLSGVFMGVCFTDYSWLEMASDDQITAYSSTGNSHCVIANRLSYHLDFQGPSVAVDTACSSSLVATHLACQSLRNRECNMALAGGVNLILTPKYTLSFTKWNMMSPDGHCKTFDADANGFVRSEGCGVVVLKRLSDALAHKDNILALVRGSAINQDGRSSGLTAPNGPSQEAVIKQALHVAGIAPSAVGYVEAHGTGTPLGDPIEVEALVETLGKGRSQPYVMGSVKANIGHTEGAAGVAGLIKTILSLQHEQIPPQIHFQALNPHIEKDESFIIPTQAHVWKRSSQPRIAGISAFGMGGTNAHIILEEPPEPHRTEAARQADLSQTDLSTIVLPISARTPEALNVLATRYGEQLAGSEIALPDLGYAASLRRTHHDFRLAVIGSSAQELSDRLHAFVSGEDVPGLHHGRALTQPKIAFVCPGQGGQWVGMGRELLRTEPIFRAAIERCEKAMQPYVDWSLSTVLEKSDPILERIDVVQPTLFAMSVALAALWESWGVVPSTVIGHSMGELAAAHIAKALTLEDAVRVICRRSQLLRRVSGQGAMVVVELSMGEAQQALIGYEEQVSIAASNSPRLTVLSGDPDALAGLTEALQKQGTFCRPIKVDVASHSPQVDVLQPDLLSALNGLQPRKAKYAFYSTVDSTLKEGSELDATYWVRNLRNPVLFSQAVQFLVNDGHTIFIELSAHPTLLTSIEQSLQVINRKTSVVLPSLRREQPERDTLLESLGHLYCLGHMPHWSALYGQQQNAPWVNLPAYPWEREHYWVEAAAAGIRPRAKQNHLLGEQIDFPGGFTIWSGEISTALFPFLNDHRVKDSVIVPASVYLDLALSIGHWTLDQVRFLSALVLLDNTTYKLQVVLEGQTFKVFSRPAQATQADWVLHADGICILRTAATPASSYESPETRTAANPPFLSGVEHYYLMQNHGLAYGPAFQRVTGIWDATPYTVAMITSPNTIAKTTANPTLLDAGLQVLANALSRSGLAKSTTTYLPTGVKTVRYYRSPISGEPLWVQADYRQQRDVLTGDVVLLDRAGNALIELLGITIQALPDRDDERDDLARLLYSLEWETQPLELVSPQHQRTCLIVSSDEQAANHFMAHLGSETRCHVVTPVTAYMLQAWQGLFDSDYSDIIYLAEQPLSSEATEPAVYPDLNNALSLVQAIVQMNYRKPPRLWWVTRGTQVLTAADSGLGLYQSPLWGLGRVAATEHPELRCTRLDLSAEPSPDEWLALAHEIQTGTLEDQVVLRGETRYVARLYQVNNDNPEGATYPVKTAEQPFRVVSSKLGILDNLGCEVFNPADVPPGEVCIQVIASGLNFLDVLMALNNQPDRSTTLPFGIECAGRIVAVGEGVTDLSVGQIVLAIALGSMASHVNAASSLVVPIPANLSIEQAATLPIAFLTAYYALSELAHLQPGERVLIHAAAGGVGLAAVQLAQQIGAEIFATAGSPEKREYLAQLGVEHIFDSRTLEFSSAISTLTNGAGVDVILNSLAGEAISHSLSILAPNGRFLEIGKQDIAAGRNFNLANLRHNIAFFAVDLIPLLERRAAYCGDLLKRLVSWVADGTLQPLPVYAVEVTEVAEAFRYMAQARHIGKVCLRMDVPEVRVGIGSQFVARHDGTYLITGGLGALGLKVAEWLIQQGAGRLVLVGRHDPSPEAGVVIDRLCANGADIRVINIDISQANQVEWLFSSLRDEGQGLPLRGVIHAAAVLDDGILLNMTEDSLKKVMLPKASGAWHLHRLTCELTLDFFVMFSSAASLFGAPGQGNYAAANAFMDALAQYRQSLGLPGLSINWGPWAEIGLAVQTDQLQRLEQQGVKSFTPADGIAVFARLLNTSFAQVGVTHFDKRQWQQAHPKVAGLPFWSALPDASTATIASTPLPFLLETNPEQRLLLLQNYIREQAARILRLSDKRIDPEQPLGTMGFDSLTGLEFRNRLENKLGLTLPATLIWNYPTLAILTDHIADLLQFEQAAPTEKFVESTVRPELGILTQIEQLSDENAEALLLEKLSKQSGSTIGRIK